MTIKHKREAAFVIISLVLTVGLYLMLCNKVAHRLYDSYYFPNPRPFYEAMAYLVAVLVLAYNAVLYQGALLGHYIRAIRHSPRPFEEIEAIYDTHAPSMTVIIPSYKEERQVMWQTMMSAALSEYPAKRVVLLIDDPHQPKTLADIRALETARALPQELQEQFHAQAAIYREAHHAFLARQQFATADAATEMHRLAEHFEQVALWLEHEMAVLAEGKPLADMPFDLRFFAETILLKPAANHRARAAQLRASLDTPWSLELIARQYARLASLFNVQFASFERKKYVNLSHDANKAMNLNCYMALVGKAWKEVETPEGLHLVECHTADATFSIPPADYINTIDADSLMTHDYVARLIHFLEQPGNENIAIAQSPCSSIPGSPVAIERIAAAGIDVQYHTHQGYTFFNASFWVGANAMLRHTAMEEIKEIHQVDGKTVTIYIQDRTVIEDTESTIDLVDKGWKLYNYPARMTYSATPADFGSLLIQRRRWANGGLIILPKLLRYGWRAKKNLRLVGELYMRFSYVAMTTISVMVGYMLIFYNFGPRVNSPLLIYANLPMLLLAARDFKVCGYRYTDVLRLGALNLMLFPILTAGVLKQFQQIVTGKKIPFGRTPKVKDRTAAPVLYYALEFGIVALLGYSIWHNVLAENWFQVVFSGLNAAFFLYALYRYIGPRAILQDIGSQMLRLNRTPTPVLTVTPPQAQPQQLAA